MADLTNTALLNGDNVSKSQAGPTVTVLSDAGDDILTVDITPSATRLRDGKPLIYTILITNTSTTIDASNVAFTDNYTDANFTVGTVTSTVSGLTFNTAILGTITSETNFTIAHSSSVTITIPGTVKYTAA